jgi:predicted unusual protein kinase regulating ubiquinone biosynthesis (AarF/ABC1/UbiB family)
MVLSIVRLYHPAPWRFFYTYRAFLILGRMLELWLKIAMYLLLQAPLLLIWTRIPGLRGRRPPLFSGLAEVLAPVEQRSSLNIGGGQLGADLGLIQSVPEATQLINAFRSEVKPPSRLWSVLGCVMRGYYTALGPAFMKFGQILSMREEVPPVIKNELQMLQDKLPPMKFKEVRKILERELDRPMEEVFEWVEETPVAAASLAQVHRAKLRKEQAEVALKIQRRHLQGMVQLDTVIICDIVFGLVNLMIPLVRKSTDTGVFTTSYRQSLEKEVDFILEERSQSRFRRLVMEHPVYSKFVKIARTYPEYTTGKLITMEFVKNYHRLDRVMDELTPQQLLEFATTKVEGSPPEAPIQLVWGMTGLYIQGMLHWGFCHGDFHLGNLYALEPEKEGDSWKIFICDFGMMIEENQEEKLMALASCLGLTYYFSGPIFASQLHRTAKNELSEEKYEDLVNACHTVFTKYMTETELGESQEKVWNVRLHRGTSSNTVTDLMYGAATMGLKMKPFGWLFFKNLSYCAETSLMHSTEISATHLIAPLVGKYLKDMIMAELDEKDAASIREAIPEVLVWLREYDRKQVLNALATGAEIKPKEKVWTKEWRETRFEVYDELREAGVGASGKEEANGQEE